MPIELEANSEENIYMEFLQTLGAEAFRAVKVNIDPIGPSNQIHTAVAAGLIELNMPCNPWISDR